MRSPSAPGPLASPPSARAGRARRAPGARRGRREWDRLLREARDTPRPHEVLEGLPVARLLLARDLLGTPLARFEEPLRASTRTLERRRHQGRLTPDESDRTERLIRLYLLACDVLEDPERAAAWMTRPVPRIGRSPLDLAATDVGAREVERSLHALDLGFAA